MPFVQMQEGRIHYLGGFVSGGLNLLFIHGAGGRADQWKDQVKAVAASVAVDLPGHGRSEGTAYHRISHYADFIRRFIQVLGLKTVEVVPVGHSMGGAVALQLALDAPGAFAALGLVSTGARLRVWPETIERFSRGEHDFGFIEAAYHQEAPPVLVQEARRQWSQTPPEVIAADLQACDRFDVMERLGEIKLPVLVTCGTGDRLTPVKYSRYLAENLPDAVLRLVEKSGHMLMLEAPAQLNRILLDFKVGIIS